MTNPDLPHDLSFRLAWLLKDLHHRRSNLAQLALSEAGLHFGHPRMLFTIAHLKGASQKEIADHLHVSPASLATSLKRLQKAGFLARSSDDADQRVNKIELTEKGQEAVRICFQLLRSIDRLMLEGLDESDKEQLFNLLSRLNNNLGKIELADIEAACGAEEQQINNPSSEVNK